MKNLMRDLLGLGVLVFVLYAATRSSPDAAQGAATPTIVPDLPGQHVSILSTSWRRGGFGAVGFAKFDLKNDNAKEVRDVTITCHFYGKSGTLMADHTQTVFDRFPAGKHKTTDELSFGFIDQQVHSVNCDVIDAS